MEAAAILRERLRSHRLSAPAASVTDAARHMLATQAQEFWGGRWALGARTRGRVTVRDVDAAFDRGEIVRSWTMRGTIHIVPAEDLAWILSLTADRQRRQAAFAHRNEGIDTDEIARAAAVARGALRGGNRLERAELFRVLEDAGVGTARQRGYHLLVALSLAGVVCQGPVVARARGMAREQYVVLTDEWIASSAAPSDPLAEYFVRYIAAHGPAGARDFAWWSSLPLGVARSAAERAGERVVQVDDEPEPLYLAAGPRSRRARGAPTVVALPPFEEYYLSYVDRTVCAAPEFVRAIGPSVNGIVRPILVAEGRVVGVWTHSHALARHGDDPVPDLFAPVDPAAVSAALDRYARFVMLRENGGIVARTR